MAKPLSGKVERAFFSNRYTRKAGLLIDHAKVSTPEQKCIGLPEQKYISDAGQKAPELGAFSSGVSLGSYYLPGCLS